MLCFRHSKLTIRMRRSEKTGQEFELKLSHCNNDDSWNFVCKDSQERKTEVGLRDKSATSEKFGKKALKLPRETVAANVRCIYCYNLCLKSKLLFKEMQWNTARMYIE